jgi:hypothetical protein
MKETLESMERRLAVVERELADMRERLNLLMSAEETPVSRGVRMLREARANQATLAATAQEVFAALGISCEPVEAEDAQRRMLAEGVRPEDNAFSRGIIEMREE